MEERGWGGDESGVGSGEGSGGRWKAMLPSGRMQSDDEDMMTINLFKISRRNRRLRPNSHHHHGQVAETGIG